MKFFSRNPHASNYMGGWGGNQHTKTWQPTKKIKIHRKKMMKETNETELTIGSKYL